MFGVSGLGIVSYCICFYVVATTMLGDRQCIRIEYHIDRSHERKAKKQNGPQWSTYHWLVVSTYPSEKYDIVS